MKLHRFFIRKKLKKGVVSIEDKELAHQLNSVLRFKAGERIIVFDGSRKESEAEIIRVSPKNAEIMISEIKENKNEPVNRTILYLAVLKRDNFEWAAEKAVEAGVSEIIPVITERTVKTNLRKDRLEKIIKESAEQSGRGELPGLSETEKFSELIGELPGDQENILFDSGGQDIKTIMAGSDSKIGAWIGPEGGFTEEEIELAKNNKFKVVSLGSLTLRAETAAVVAAFLLSHRGDLKIDKNK